MNVKTCNKPEKNTVEPPKDPKLEYCEQLRKKEEKNRIKEEEEAGIYQPKPQQAPNLPPQPPPPPSSSIAVCRDKIKNCPPKIRKEGEKETTIPCRVAVKIAGHDICDKVEKNIKKLGKLKDSGPNCSAVDTKPAKTFKEEIDPCDELRKEKKRQECEEKRRRYYE